MPCIRRIGPAVVLAGLSMGVATSCGDHPAAPGAPANRTIAIELTAPVEIAPGDAVQLAVRSRRADGTAQDVTSQVRWTASNLHAPGQAAVLEVNASGVARALDVGFVLLSADFEESRAVTSVAIVPPGTFFMAGTVRDGPVPLAGAAVVVTAGIGSGAAAVSNDDGSFYLFGVRGLIDMRVSKHGFRDEVQRHNVSNHIPLASGRIVVMAPSEPRLDLGGEYALTIATDPNCTALPEAARQRTYTARVTRAGYSLSVALHGATFVVHPGEFLPSGDSFEGQVSSTGEALFWLGFYWGSYAIAERFEGGSLLYDGQVQGRVTGDGITGRMVGYLTLSTSATYPFDPRGLRCSTDRFTMVRR